MMNKNQCALTSSCLRPSWGPRQSSWTVSSPYFLIRFMNVTVLGHGFPWLCLLWFWSSLLDSTMYACTYIRHIFLASAPKAREEKRKGTKRISGALAKNICRIYVCAYMVESSKLDQNHNRHNHGNPWPKIVTFINLIRKYGEDTVQEGCRGP